MDQNAIITKYKLQEFNDLLEKIENDVSEAMDKLNVKTSTDNMNFLLYTLGKSILTTRELIVLCWSGFPDGALSLARNVFEQFIIVAYIEGKKTNSSIAEMLTKYNDDYVVQRAKALKFEAENVNVSKEKAEMYYNQLQNIKDKYELKRIKDYWWSGENSFSNICDKVVEQNTEMKEMIRLMQLIYKRACLSIHASCMGNKIRLGSNASAIDMGPWESGQESALFLANSSLIYIVGSVYSFLKIDFHTVMKELNNFALYYQNLIRECTKRDDQN